MKRQYLNIVIALFLLFPCQSIATSAKVAPWVQETLLKTLTFQYNQHQSHFDSVRQNYSYNAWDALGEFLNGYYNMVIEHHLSLHPIAVSPATVVNSGTIQKSNFFKGIRYWRVNQIIAIPELDNHIAFSVVVIAKAPNSYLIVSLDMAMKNEQN